MMAGTPMCALQADTLTPEMQSLLQGSRFCVFNAEMYAFHFDAVSAADL